MDTPALNFKSEAVGHLLEDRWLEVPAYQRPYAWERENVSEFWADLRGAQADRRQYFLGAIVLTRGEARDHIIDGQQRLATASLLLAAIRDELLSQDEKELAQHVDQQYLARYNPKTRQSESKLLLGPADAVYYSERFLKRTGGEPTSSSQRRLTTAFEYLRTEIANAALDAAGLMSWVDLLTGSVLVVLVEAATEADAFQIFETLNDRGAPLTLADLLKNYLISLQPTSHEVIAHAWDATSENLGPDSETQDLVTFIRHYWSSLKGATRERDLYKSLRTSIRDEDSATSFATDLAKSSEYYAAILDSTHPIWSGRSIAPRAIETLLYLQLGQYRPLLLAALDHFEENEIEILTEAMVSWSLRGLIVGGIGGGTTERAYASAGVNIRQGKSKNTHDVFNQLRPIIPSDDEFRSGFESTNIPRIRVGQYVMRSLNRKLGDVIHAGLEDTEAGPGDTFALAQVLPRRANPVGWPGFAPDDLGSYVTRIGNLALQQGGGPGPMDWESRKEWLLSFNAPINEAISRAERWSPESIRHRQQELATIAIQTWPRAGVSH